MSFINSIKAALFPVKTQEPSMAYDLWADAYDNQPGNLMLDLDEGIFSELMEGANAANKVIADIGCGTGRHWDKIVARKPARLIGYDVSAGMLDRLKQKFPQAETFLLENNSLVVLPDYSCDMIISTLTVAHIKHIKEAFNEWNRVLKPGSEIIFTDYHPVALTKGGKRTFKYEGKTIAVRNYIHPLEEIRILTKQLGWIELRFIEKVIGDSVKRYYEAQDAVALFDAFRNTPIIYGIHLKKADDTA
jgi:ubiquinone/menaquinone biosynthesis C-methylase UbiE